MARTRKLLAPLEQVSKREALGQMGGSGDLESDIALCALQTIEPLFLRYLPAKGRILEAGAGQGKWLFYLRRKGYDVTGIEIAKSEIRAAREFDPAAPIAEGNVLHMDFPDRSFDAILSLGVVEHFEEGPQAAFAEIRRVLKPGGLLLVTVPTQSLARILVFNRIKDLQYLFWRLQRVTAAFEEYRYTRNRFEALLREAGFAILATAPDDFVPPKNMGLFTDSRFLQRRGHLWELNAAGRAINAVAGAISPWLACSGTLWVCRSG